MVDAVHEPMTRLPGLAFVCVFAGCGGKSPPPEPPPSATAAVEPAPPAIDPAILARGEYVAELGGCAACHTPLDATGGFSTTKAFAGGVEAPGPNGKGIWRAPNITPDATTGIGAWTNAQIDTAIRRGILPSNHALAPVMPHQYFARMTDADADALVAFLRQLPAVSHRVRRSEGLVIPADMPPAAMGGAGDPAGDERAHGEYLATVMHCAACHTPRDGAHAGELLSGGVAFDNPLSAGGGTLFSANL